MGDGAGLFAQLVVGWVEVTTYFCTPLMKLANGSSSAVGQYPAHSSYIRRPRSTASWAPITVARFAYISSSKSKTYVSGDSATPSADSNR